MITLQTGYGIKSWSLLDLWNANGKPERIAVAAYGPATCKLDGFRWSAITGYACAAGAIGLKEKDGKLFGTVAGTVVPMSWFLSNPTLLNVLDSIAGVALTTYGVDWWNASRWAKNGYWVRRKVWLDVSHKMRFEAGTGGTANAVAVFQGNTITKRVVKNTDFGALDFDAIDWVVPDAPVEIDLTDAVLSAEGQWMLGYTGATVVTGGTGTGTGTGTGGTTTTTTTGQTPAEVEASETAAEEGIDTYCQRTLTRVQLDIATGIAQQMRAQAAFGNWTEEQLAYVLTSFLRGAVEQMINAAGHVVCSAYYEKMVLSYYNLDADGDASTQGEAGTPGSVWYNSTTYPPSDGVGIDGDYYLITPAGGVPYDVMIYYKVGGTWTAIFAI